MSTDCIFCAIVAGDVPGRIVHEGEAVTAFLDANPLAPGHTLLVPNDHASRLTDVPADAASELHEAIEGLVPAVERAVDADGTTVAVNDGAAAGQEVPHTHWHVVPRFENDGGGPIHAAFGERPDVTDDELDDIADRIHTAN